MAIDKLFAHGRWPALYSVESLKLAISTIIRAEAFDARFYALVDKTEPLVCQGDVVELSTLAPEIDASGDAVADKAVDHWLVIGNTCDFARDVNVDHTQMVPLVALAGASDDEIGRYRRYEPYRSFYVPPWPNAPNRLHRLADFVRPVTVQKQAFDVGSARVVARMQFTAWALLHTCLVRFLARDDGRMD